MFEMDCRIHKSLHTLTHSVYPYTTHTHSHGIHPRPSDVMQQTNALLCANGIYQENHAKASSFGWNNVDKILNGGRVTYVYTRALW